MKNHALAPYYPHKLYSNFIVGYLTKLADEAKSRNQQDDEAFLRELAAFYNAQPDGLSNFSSVKDIFFTKFKTPSGYVPTGFKIFDFYLGGLKKATFSVLENKIGGTLSTQTALQISHYVGVEKQIPTALFSFHWDKNQLWNWFLREQLNKNLFPVSDGYSSAEWVKFALSPFFFDSVCGPLTFTEWETVVNTVKAFQHSPLFIEDKKLSLEEIYLRSYRLAQRLRSGGKELGLVVIDGIENIRQKLNLPVPESQQIFKTLQCLARELSVPVLLVAGDSLARNPQQLCDLAEYSFVDLLARLQKGISSRELLVFKSPNGVIGNLGWLGKEF